MAASLSAGKAVFQEQQVYGLLLVTDEFLLIIGEGIISFAPSTFSAISFKPFPPRSTHLTALLTAPIGSCLHVFLWILVEDGSSAL